MKTLTFDVYEITYYGFVIVVYAILIMEVNTMNIVCNMGLQSAQADKRADDKILDWRENG